MYAYRVLLVALIFGLSSCSQNDPKPGLNGSAAVSPGDISRAAGSGNVPLIQTLLSRGANVNENVGTAGKPVTPLLIAIMKKQQAAAIELVKAGASLDTSYLGYRPHEFVLHQFGGDSEISKLIERR